MQVYDEYDRMYICSDCCDILLVDVKCEDKMQRVMNRKSYEKYYGKDTKRYSGDIRKYFRKRVREKTKEPVSKKNKIYL